MKVHFDGGIDYGSLRLVFVCVQVGMREWVISLVSHCRSLRACESLRIPGRAILNTKQVAQLGRNTLNCTASQPGCGENGT